MSDLLAKALLDTGMLETGLFQQGDGQPVPFRFRLEMLPSYPDLLAEMAEQSAALLRPIHIDRLVCPIDALPVGTVLSLKSGIPLVYSRGRGESPVFDLVGAYDVGHPACLILNALEGREAVENLTRSAKSVGLNIRHILALVDCEISNVSDIPYQSILTLSGITQTLAQANLMTPLMVQSLLNWQSYQQA